MKLQIVENMPQFKKNYPKNSIKAVVSRKNVCAADFDKENFAWVSILTSRHSLQFSRFLDLTGMRHSLRVRRGRAA